MSEDRLSIKCPNCGVWSIVFREQLLWSNSDVNYLLQCTACLESFRPIHTSSVSKNEEHLKPPNIDYLFSGALYKPPLSDEWEK